MFCKNCGKELTLELDPNCPYCGKLVKDASPAPEHSVQSSEVIKRNDKPWYSDKKFRIACGAGGLLLLIITLFGWSSIIAAVGNVGKQNIISSEQPSYHNEAYGFSMDYPKGWTVKENAQVAGLTTLVAFRGCRRTFHSNL